MGDEVARAVEYERRAEKMLMESRSKQEEVAQLFQNAANLYKLTELWDKAGPTYMKLANIHLKMDGKLGAAQAYVEAGLSYKNTNTAEAISCLGGAIDMYRELGIISVSADCYEEIAKLYESNSKMEKSMEFYETAADLFQIEKLQMTANKCKQKVAQCAAELKQYQKSIEIYEELARYSLSLNLNYEAEGHLLNAGICQLCKGDVVAISNALGRYQDLDPTFSRSREYRFLADIATAIDEEDVVKFARTVKKFICSLTPSESWKTDLLIRVKRKLKAKELLVEDNLT